MAVSIIGPKFYAWASDTGAPLAFGKVFTYQAGTNTPKATFQSEDGVTENANPVILNGAGYAGIYLIGSYKIVVKDADDVEVWTADPVTDASGLQNDQRGVPEWNADQEYYQGSVVTTLAGVYRLKSGGDGSSDPDTDGGVNWTQLPTREEVDAKADQATTYTETEVNNLLDAKADQATTYTETEVNNLIDAKADQATTADILVTVGTGGDYPTINAALEYLSKLQPVYASAGITATINLLTGFTMAEQVLVRGLDMGWVTITGADAETVITHTALTTDFTTADYGFISYPAFGVSKGGVLPRIDQLFTFDVANVGDGKNGIMAVGAGSSADVLAGAGVNDAGSFGIIADNGSTINAEEANASGAGSFGIAASRSSTINAHAADASGAGTYGIYAYNGSTINAEGADASGAVTNGIAASRSSTINAHAADASGAGTYGIFAEDGSTINAEEANASGAGSHGIYADDGSTINAEEANASGAGATGIYARRVSTVNADSADASGAGSHGIYADDGSTINADTADVSSAGNYGIYANDGSTINADSADASGAGALGIYAKAGSTVNAAGATGTLAQAKNTVTNNGIIFQEG